MITLASKSWNIDVKTTIDRLVGLNVVEEQATHPRVIERYLRRVPDHLHRVTQFWEQSQDLHTHTTNTELVKLQRRLMSVPQNELWTERAGKFIGSNFADTAEVVLRPDGYGGAPEIRRNLFSGEGWKNILVAPSYDLPGRICGFICIGRTARPYADWRFVRGLNNSFEGGIGMLPALMQGKTKEFGRTQFVLTDPDIAIMLQARHLMDHAAPLPLGIVWDDGYFCTKNVWDWFTASDLIFWGTDIVKAIAQAMKCNGKVSRLHITPKSIENKLIHNHPVVWLRRMRERAVWWNTALQEYLADLSLVDIEEVLIRLNIYGQHLDKFAAGCAPELRQQLASLKTARINTKVINVGNTRVFEREDSWYVGKETTPITNAIPRIDYMVKYNNRTYYKGRILFNGGVYPFMERVSVLQKGFFRWMDNYLCNVLGTAKPIIRKRRIRDQQIGIAKLFHPPKKQIVSAGIGWDQHQHRFNFARFAVNGDGVTAENFVGLRGDSTPIPWATLPLRVPANAVRQLKDADEASLLWAMSACVLSNIIAPAVNKNRWGILLDGNTDAGIRIAEQLGCLTVNDLESLQREVSQHDIPVITHDVAVAQVEPVLDRTITASNWVTNSVLSLLRHTCTVTCSDKVRAKDTAYIASHIVTNYIKYLCDSQMLLPDNSSHLPDRVLANMSRWAASIGVDPESVMNSRKLLRITHDHSNGWLFVELVNRLIREKLLDPVKHVTVGQQRYITINQQHFTATITNAGAGILPVNRVSRLLRKEGCLLTPVSELWRIDKDWWTNQLQQVRKYDTRN